MKYKVWDKVRSIQTMHDMIEWLVDNPDHPIDITITRKFWVIDKKPIRWAQCTCIIIDDPIDVSGKV